MMASVTCLLLCAGAIAVQNAKPDVIIVGAGWAGMSAAHTLAKNNVSFIVLEAHNYTGGRTHAIQFGDPSVHVGTMEIGSGWLESSGKATGDGPAAANVDNAPPLVALAKQMSPPLKWSFIPGSSQNQSNYKRVLTADGKDGDADGKIRDAANAAYACIDKAAKRSKTQDTTVRKALEKCGWNPKTPVEMAVDWALTVDDPGMLPETQSLKNSLPDEVYEWWGPDDHFIIDQRPRGYAGVMDEMVKDTIPPGDERIMFNMMVSNVAYDTDGVTITTTDGQKFTAPTAITTFPLGVLNRKHRELFTPNVPTKLAKILEAGNFIMSNLTRVYIQFPVSGLQGGGV
jgi:monoamine oxidase